MLCYKDRWFCTSYKTCQFGEMCCRALTEKVKESAKKWWNNNQSEPPISTVEKPQCYKQIKQS